MTDGELADIICRDYANNMVKDENNRYGWSYAYNECLKDIDDYSHEELVESARKCEMEEKQMEEKLLFTNDKSILIRNEIPESIAERANIINDLEQEEIFYDELAKHDLSEYISFDGHYGDLSQEVQDSINDVMYDVIEDYFMRDYNYDYVIDSAVNEFNQSMSDIGLTTSNLAENFLIYGSNMGWKKLSGYELAKIEDPIDIVEVLERNTDCNVNLYYNPDAKCLSASVTSHDEPLGAYFEIIPLQWAEEYAMKDYKNLSQIITTMHDDCDVLDAIWEDSRPVYDLYEKLTKKIGFDEDAYYTLPEEADFRNKLKIELAREVINHPEWNIYPDSFINEITRKEKMTPDEINLAADYYKNKTSGEKAEDIVQAMAQDKISSNKYSVIALAAGYMPKEIKAAVANQKETETHQAVSNNRSISK